MIDETNLSQEYSDFFQKRKITIEKKFSQKRINTYFFETKKEAQDKLSYFNSEI